MKVQRSTLQIASYILANLIYEKMIGRWVLKYLFLYGMPAED